MHLKSYSAYKFLCFIIAKKLIRKKTYLTDCDQSMEIHTGDRSDWLKCTGNKIVQAACGSGNKEACGPNSYKLWCQTGAGNMHFLSYTCWSQNWGKSASKSFFCRLFTLGVTVMPLFHQRIKPRSCRRPLIVGSLGKNGKKIDQWGGRQNRYEGLGLTTDRPQDAPGGPRQSLTGLGLRTD